MTTRRTLSRAAAALVAGLLLVAAVVVARSDPPHRVTAVFPRTVSLYEGSDVRIMGLRVGTVESIVPSGTEVRVTMTYDDRYELPADARAVIMSPSIIADRFVQLTPAYVDGPRLADGAVIGRQDTGVPVELDQTFETTNDLMKALGPEGANRDGAVSDLLGVLAEVLDGQGKDLRRTVADAADLTDTVAAGSDEITGSVQNLAGLTRELATYDESVAEFNQQLAGVADVLADDRDDISALLTSLASSLGEVDSFVRDNRASLVTNVESLVTVTRALQAERTALAQVVDIAPLAFTNLVNTYDPATQSVRTRANFAELLRDLDGVICNALKSQAGESVDGACRLLGQIVSGLPTAGGLDLDDPSGRSRDPLGATAADPEQQVAALVTGLADAVGNLLGGEAS